MRTVVTGAGGFIGRALVAALRRRAGAGDEIVATDRNSGADGFGKSGDIADPAHVADLFAAPVDRAFHLAGIASGAAEADVDAAERVNVEAAMLLLRHCRAQRRRGGAVVRFVHASSIAVFGAPLPARIDDATVPAPTLSYGVHKRVVELLVGDASRRGDIDGVSLRLAGVVARPAAASLANGARSAFNSDVIREPLAGRDVDCPVSPEATIWITALPTAVAHLLIVAEADLAPLGGDRAVTAPTLAASVAEIAAALGRVDPAAPARIRYRPDAGVEAQFGRWPRSCAFARAAALGLAADASLDAIVAAHLASLTP